ncbi:MULTISPECIES: hypothetical protein [Bacillus]|uniref:hypothetical protein n=1 Tax=Bacillus TaxID=1386 RepID=UPI000BFDC214|nr:MULTISPECIES: hypothetical protein [Bacillus]MCR6850042.1 hypothetical protein [Bacillus sp. IBL03825]PGK38674.1 hypothetical protein CN908_17055 [Bacillus thuringiensis]
MKDKFLFNYDFNLLRNFNIRPLNKFLETQIDDYKSLLKKHKTNNGYHTIISVLNEQISNGFNDMEIESILFKSLVYPNNEKLFYLDLNTNLDVILAMELLLEKYPEIINRKLTKIINSEEDLISIRQEEDKVIFLFKEGVGELGSKKKEKCNFYVPCILDFKQKHMQIRFNQQLLRSCRIKGKDLLKKMEIFIHNLFNTSIKGNELRLKTIKGNEAKIHKGLYTLFKKESSRSLDLIRCKVKERESTLEKEWTEESLRTEISKYLQKELRVLDPGPYVNRVLSVKYQDTAKNMEEVEFINDGGYIFGFTFVDRKITKSANKNEKRKPVYYSKIYWDLKDTIEDYEEVVELAVYWKFCKDKFNKKITKLESPENLSFVEVCFKETYNVLEIHYYVNYNKEYNLIKSLDERMYRENYVLNKIKEVI